MTREWWADGPTDDRDAMALEAAREEVLNDDAECQAIAAKVRAEFSTEIDEICSGAWTVDGAKDIAARMCAAADLEIDKRAQKRVDDRLQDRAERRIDAAEYAMGER